MPVKPADVPNAAGQPDFQFRARAIRFTQFPVYGSEPSLAVATSGCCASAESRLPGGRILSYFHYRATDRRWASEALQPPGGQGAGALARFPDSYYGLI